MLIHVPDVISCKVGGAGRTVIQQAREGRKQTKKKRYVNQNETLAHEPSVLP